MFKKLLLLLVVTSMATYCTKTDTRILGTIDGKNISVQDFLDTSFSKEEIKQYKSQLTDENIENMFKQHVMLLAFSKQADKEKFFDIPTNKTLLEDQVNAVEDSVYPKYLGEKLLDSKMNSIKVSDDDLKPYQKRVQVRHILLKKDGLGKDPKEVKRITDLVLDNVNNKKQSFGDLAEKYSEDPGSAKNKGLIEDWIYENSPFVESFKNAALKGKKGDVIPNVVSEYGTHIIYIENAQKRSDSEIKKSDPAIISSIEKKKKEKIIDDFNAQLLKEFKDRIITNPHQNLMALLQNHTKNQDVVIAEIKDFKKITLGYFFSTLFRDEANFTNFTKSIARAKLDANEQLNQALNNNLILLNLYILKAKEIGADTDPTMKAKIDFNINQAKGTLYANNIVSKIPKTPVPHFSVSDREIQDFYNQNKANYFTQKDPKDAKKSVVTPLNASTKEKISQFLLNQKKSTFEQEEQMKQYNVLDSKAQALYPELGIKVTALSKK
jgi:parvulin-like peptidyl-prolyl isomerase